MKRTLKIPSKIDRLNIVDKIIEEINRKVKLSEEIYGNVLLSLSEATLNAIVHGNKFNSKKKVTINYEIKNDYLTIVVADEGEGFDPDSLPDPTSPENIEKLHSRGVYIIKHLCDEIAFDYDKGQKVIMKFKLK